MLAVEVVTMAQYDVVILGGGAAGLSGALMLGRARRSVLVVDGGEPRNAPAAHMHGFLGHDGASPLELLKTGREEAAGYGVETVTGQAQTVSKEDGGFVVELDTGAKVKARRVLAATGIIDELPDIPGLAQRWGRDVVHCPYCHGWEFRDEAVGVLATGPQSVHQAQLFRQLTGEVVYFTHTGPGLTDEEAEGLAARGITVVDGEVAQVEVADDRITGVRLSGGEVVPLRALVVAPRSRPRADMLAPLGLHPTPQPNGDSITAVDPTGRTEVPGVWVAGNLTSLFATVVVAAASGSMAGAAINADLIAEETRLAVATRRDPFSHESEARTCESVMGDRRHGL